MINTFGGIPSPESEMLNDIYKHDSYQFIIDNEVGERILDCTFSQEDIIAEVQINSHLDLNALSSYCSVTL